jgi:pteridine reductase
MNSAKVALITGSAQRIGAQIAQTLHQHGYRLVLHYRHSAAAAEALAETLNQQRADSACVVQADLAKQGDIERLAEQAISAFGHIDLLVNNASSFYPTEIGKVDEAIWDDLMSSNLKAPFFLSQALSTTLKNKEGAIINLIDIHADRPLKNHPVYCMAKAGLAMMTKTLAKELGPQVRVNGVAPGAILWPQQGDGDFSETEKQDILDRVPLERSGSPSDIADTVLFIADGAPYITGQIIAVDGGRTLHG